jgi:cytochrome c biogenesis protein CcmG/thiol:disulfide interchange protein DsbE
MKQFLAILGVFFVLSAFSISNTPDTTTTDGHTLPEVDVKTLDGKSVNIQDLVGNGKITVISFWATWCSPCKRELDAIAEIYPDWQEEYGMELLAVTIDDARGVAKVPAMVASKGWEYKVLSDSKQELQRALNFQTVPQTFLLNAQGEIIYTHSGYSPGDEYELEEEIKKAAGK